MSIIEWGFAVFLSASVVLVLAFFILAAVNIAVALHEHSWRP